MIEQIRKGAFWSSFSLRPGAEGMTTVRKQIHHVEALCLSWIDDRYDHFFYSMIQVYRVITKGLLLVSQVLQNQLRASYVSHTATIPRDNF